MKKNKDFQSVGDHFLHDYLIWITLEWSGLNSTEKGRKNFKAKAVMETDFDSEVKFRL